MVALTARSAASPKEMGIALRGRLEALARAHDLIQPVIGEVGSDRPGTTVADLVRAVLAPYETGEEPHPLTVEGPALTVGSNAATALTLVLHELATNAVKYGALCVPEGRVAIDWTEADGRVTIRWVESGGPAVREPPSAEGFGSQLARKSITGQLGGSLVQDWHPEGLRVTVRFPAERLSR
jgi:two-component sensor histidine kinase